MSETPETPRPRICVLTAPGRGAIAVVAVVGPDALELVASRFQPVSGRALPEQPLSRIVYGHWGGSMGEDLVVCRRTTDEIEIHCHGGTESAARIVAALVRAGAEQVNWQDWVARRSNSQLEAEAQVALASAPTLRTATILLDQYHGALRRELEATVGSLESDDVSAAQNRIEQLLSRMNLGLHLTQPRRVAIVGRPNVGKSTLINALAGYQRAIEFDQPGTTRDVVSVHTALAGWPVELSDTAGLHATTDEIERAGIELARQLIRQADLVLWVLDMFDFRDAAAKTVEEIVAGQAVAVELTCDPSRTLVVVNKCDVATPPESLGGECLEISAATGMGIANLIDVLAQRLVPQPPAAGEAVPFTARQAEMLRESLELCRGQEAACAARVLRQLLASA